MLYGKSNSWRTITFSQTRPNRNIIFVFSIAQFAKCPACFMW